MAEPPESGASHSRKIEPGRIDKMVGVPGTVAGVPVDVRGVDEPSSLVAVTAML
jgi:hypothetical protein